ncbi:MAG: GGDEF domain-containing protein [Kineosporiaceae bacterium]
MATTTARHGAPVADMSLSAGLAGAAFSVAALVGVFAVCDAGFGGLWRWHLAAGSAAASTVIAAVGAWHRRGAISVGGSAHAAGVCALACALNSAYHVVLTADPLATGPLLLTVLASGVVLPLARWLLVVDVVAVVGYVPTAVLHTDVVGWTEIGVSLAMAIGGSHVLHTLRARGHAQLQALTDALAEQATRDQLTGLLNRRGLAGICVDLAALPGRLGVVCLDVDGFKHINDELGHAAGDGVLVEIADRLSGIAGDDGVLVRLGGDEFALLVPGAEPEIVEQLAHRVRIRLAGTAGVLGLPWAASVGTASGVVASAQDVERLLAAADLAMYDDKQARRGLRGTAPGAAAPARAEVGGC